MKRLITHELVVVFAIVGLATMAMSLLQPVLPLYLTSIGISPTVLGLMFSTGMAGMVLGESSGGWLADRTTIKVPLFIGTCACAPMVLAFVFTRTTALIFAIFFTWGVVRAAIFGPSRGYIGANIPPTYKATLLAIYGASMAVSRGIGTAASGFITDAWGYDQIFYVAAGIGVVGGVLALVGLKRRDPKAYPPPALAVIRETQAANGPQSHRQFVYQCIIAAVYFAAIGTGPFLSLLGAQVAGLAASEVGLLFTIGSVVNAVLLIPMGRVADRRSKKAMMILGLLVTAAGQAVVALSHGFPQITLGVIIQNTGGAMFAPAAVAMLSQNVPAHRQSTAMGIYGGCEDIGVIVGSAMGGVIWSAFGPQWTFLLMGTAGASAGAVVCLALLKDRAQNRAINETTAA